MYVSSSLRDPPLQVLGRKSVLPIRSEGGRVCRRAVLAAGGGWKKWWLAVAVMLLLLAMLRFVS
ncbi:MAG TPA: hypothetical protein VJZ71_10870 [Phycisphaerae bacterium]|nr:hypothetical protein [Phycisphaerae bacterium]